MGNFKIKEVFLVDDDAIVRMVASKILKSIGFDKKISQFENGSLAILEIKSRISQHAIGSDSDPVLLLLDINMPIMDAWEFLTEYSQLDEEIKKHFSIVIITSSIDIHDRQMAFSYPDVKDYITKPISGTYVLDFLSRNGLYEE